MNTAVFHGELDLCYRAQLHGFIVREEGGNRDFIRIGFCSGIHGRTPGRNRYGNLVAAHGLHSFGYSAFGTIGRAKDDRLNFVDAGIADIGVEMVDQGTVFHLCHVDYAGKADQFLILTIGIELNAFEHILFCRQGVFVLAVNHLGPFYP